MYLIDTNIISETRKKNRANPGVVNFFQRAREQSTPLFLSVITIGELRRGVEKIRHRKDYQQVAQLEAWLNTVVTEYREHILDFGLEEAQVWGHLRAPHYENAIDKQIAAIALTANLTIVTRNTNDYRMTGAKVLNPFV